MPVEPNQTSISYWRYEFFNELRQTYAAIRRFANLKTLNIELLF